MLVMKEGIPYWFCVFLLWYDRVENLRDHYQLQASSDLEFVNRVTNIAVQFEEKTFRNSATQVVILIKFQTPLVQTAVCKTVITNRFRLCSRKYVFNFFRDLFIYQPWFGDSYVLSNFLCCQLSTECFSFYQYNWLFFPK